MNYNLKVFFIIQLVMLNVKMTLSQVSQNWTARYSSTLASIDGGKAIVVDSIGNIYTTGASNGDFATIKYSPSGNQQWVSRFNGFGNGPDIPNAMVIDSKGNIYVTGSSQYNSSNVDFVTIKYSSDGYQLWIARYPGIGNQNFPTSMAIDKFDNIYVTGKNFEYYATIKYDSSGIQQWLAEYSAPVYQDIPWAIAVDDSCNVYITGESMSDIVTIKYNSSGTQKWVSSYSGQMNRQDFALSIGLDSSLNVYVSGSSVENTDIYGGYVTVKYNPLGIEQWVRYYEGSGNFIDIVESMKVDKYGNAYVTGYSTESGQGYNMTTIKYNTNGDTMWKKSYNNGSNDIAFGVAFDIQGNVYVTGQSDGSGTNEDYATVKYNSFGVQQWVKRYDYSGQFGDYPQDIVVDNIGSVFVTGQSNRDFLTVKYSQLTGAIINESIIPTEYNLSQNYPNPFNPNTIINYQCSIRHGGSNYVSLKVYDVLGNEVRTLVNENKPAGNYEIEFDGSRLSSGIYFYSLIIDGKLKDSKRMVLLK